MSNHEAQGEGKYAIQSLELAMKMLSTMAEYGKPMTLSQLSELCDEAPSKLHRYLTTLSAMNFISHRDKHSQYSLGRGCIHLGLAAMRQVDLFSNVNNGLSALADELGHHTFMAIWTAVGPIMIRWAFSSDAVTVNTHPGQLLSVTRSSSGRVFAAFLNKATTEPLIERELASFSADSGYVALIRERIQDAMTMKYAVSRGELEQHLKSVSVPVFDWHDHSIVVVGCVMSIEADEQQMDVAAKTLQAFAQKASLSPNFSYFSDHGRTAETPAGKSNG